MRIISISANTSWYIYNFRKNTVIELLSHGYEVFVIAPHDSYSKKLQDLGCKFLHLSLDSSGTNPLKDCYVIWQFWRYFRENDIHCTLNFTPKNNIYGTLAAWLHGTKAINNIAGLGVLFISESFSSKIVRLLYKVSQNKASKVFFQNEEDRRLFLDNKIATTVPTDRLPGSGVDLSRFTLTPAPDDNKVRFLLIARMLYDKGIQQYVDAARYLKQKHGTNVEFRLLGFLDVNNPSAVSTLDMNSWVAEGVINYLGISDNVEQEIAKVDCMVLPSYYREGVPKSLLEAGAMGKPIVTTDNVGCRETVDDGVNGFLCDLRSTESLILQLEKIIDMPYKQRLKMGVASRSKIERDFDEKIVIDKYLDAIRDCL